MYSTTYRAIKRSRGGSGLRLAQSGGGDWASWCLVGAAIAITLGALVTWFAVAGMAQRKHEIERETLCLIRGDIPAATWILLDRTDPLAFRSSDTFRAIVYRYADRTPRYGKLLLSSFAASLSDDLNPQFSRCKPGSARDASLNAGGAALQGIYDAQFKAPLDRAINSATMPASDVRSPIAEQIERAVTDYGVNWTAQSRTLVVATDGLENTPVSPVYWTGHIALPKAHPGALAGIHVEFVELPNPRHAELQNDELRSKWRQWFLEEGAASVSMRSPGMDQASSH